MSILFPAADGRPRRAHRAVAAVASVALLGLGTLMTAPPALAEGPTPDPSSSAVTTDTPTSTPTSTSTSDTTSPISQATTHVASTASTATSTSSSTASPSSQSSTAPTAAGTTASRALTATSAPATSSPPATATGASSPIKNKPQEGEDEDDTPITTLKSCSDATINGDPPSDLNYIDPLTGNFVVGASVSVANNGTYSTDSYTLDFFVPETLFHDTTNPADVIGDIYYRPDEVIKMIELSSLILDGSATVKLTKTSNGATVHLELMRSPEGFGGLAGNSEWQSGAFYITIKSAHATVRGEPVTIQATATFTLGNDATQCSTDAILLTSSTTPKLKLDKAITKASYTPGDTVKYMLTITPEFASGFQEYDGIWPTLTLTDTLPAGTRCSTPTTAADVTPELPEITDPDAVESSFSCDDETGVFTAIIPASYYLLMGSAIKIPLTLKIDSLAGQCVPSNYADVNYTGANGEPNLESDGPRATANSPYSEAMCRTYDPATLTLKKGLVGAGPFGPGDAVDFTLSLTAGGELGTGAVTVTDTLPGGLDCVGVDVPNTNWTASCDPTTRIVTLYSAVALSSGSTVTFTLHTKVSAEATDGTLTNKAVATSASGAESNLATAGVNIVVPVLKLTKALTTPHDEPFVRGEALSYTLTFSVEKGTARGPITVTDTLPTGVDYVSATAPAGWSGPTLDSVSRVITFTRATDMTSADGSAVFTITAKVSDKALAGIALNTAQAKDKNGNTATGEAPITVTVPPTTTAPPTPTAPVTTAPVTTAPVTTSPVTTSPVTTAPPTTAPVTTSPQTTPPVTPTETDSSPTATGSPEPGAIDTSLNPAGPTDPSPGGNSHGTIPYTGAASTVPIAAGAVLIILGAALVAFRRRAQATK